MTNYEESQNRYPLSRLSPSEYLRRASSASEHRCAEIALYLGESDMRYILARLYQFGGDMHLIDETYSEVKDAANRGKCRDKRKLFNHILTRKLKDYQQKYENK